MPGSISETRLCGPGAHVGEVPREGQPAAAQVVGAQGLAGRVRRVGHRRDRADVGEHEQRRVVEVDVRVPQRVEDQRPAGLVGGVVDDQHAVVRRLGVAPAGRNGERQPSGRDAEERSPTTATGRAAASRRGRSPATRTAPRPTRMPLTGTRETSTKPVRTVPTIAPTVPMPDRRPTTVPVSSRFVSSSFVTIGVTAESIAPGTRIVSAATNESSSGAVSATRPDDRRRDRDDHARHAQQRAQQPPRVGPVGRPATAPRAEGDRAERDADHQRAGLEGETEVRREQPQHGQLDHEHGRGRAEDQRRSRPVPQGGRADRGAHVVSGSW